MLAIDAGACELEVFNGGAGSDPFNLAHSGQGHNLSLSMPLHPALGGLDPAQWPVVA